MAAPDAGLQQHQPHRIGLPVLDQALQLLAGHLRQALLAAVAYRSADVASQALQAQALPLVVVRAHQVADIEQLQQPALGLSLQPATGVQCMAVHGTKIQIQRLSLPIGGITFEHQPAMVLQVILHPSGMLGRHGQQGTQRARQAQHLTLLVEPHLQTDRQRRLGHRCLATQPAIENAAHSCRLAWACKRWGSRGTSPINGSTSTGMTLVSLFFG
ncbi:hypothetical protein [Pseudomonas sp. BNK-44-a]|uniref:hypothetical protein n=1 Tax=Pseudomonas sp. BNK-44-a TaxID=3376178 RepID=UPI0039BFEADD